MRKIPTLFARDWDGDRRYVLPEVTPGCEWVIDGQGTPTRKYDGTCVMFDGERWWARREVKHGKPVPAGYVPLGTDPETGKTIGWEPVEQSAFARWHAEAVRESDDENWPHPWPHGTYELIGPKINGNPEGEDAHILVAHSAAEILNPPRDFDGLAKWLRVHPYEGIVWHGGPNGAMAKIKKKDFPAAAVTVPEEFGDGSEGSARRAVDEWLAKQVAVYGETREVEPLSADDHTRIDPFDEIAIVAPHMQVIPVIVPEEDGTE